MSIRLTIGDESAWLLVRELERGARCQGGSVSAAKLCRIAAEIRLAMQAAGVKESEEPEGTDK